MPLIQLIVLALVQGLTEFLPISSSAHLILAPDALGVADQGRTGKAAQSQILASVAGHGTM